MKYLAHELKNYYKKLNHKIEFINGYSLNSLALTIWERLNYQGMEPAMLSRVINGKRLFTLKQLYAFANVLKLNTNQRKKLLKALQLDLLIRAGFSKQLFRTKVNTKLIDLFLSVPEQLTEIVRKLRDTGHPQYVIELVSIFDSFLDEISIHYPNHWKKNKRIFGHLYNERARAFGEIALPDRILNLMLPDTQKAINIGQETNCQDILGMGYMNLGGAYYVSKKWRDSAQYLEKHLVDVNLNTQIEFLRTIMLDYAFLNESNNFRRIRNIGYSKIEKKSSDNFLIVSFLEALARSTVLTGSLKSARKIIEEAEVLCNKESKRVRLRKPFFESQVTRGKLFILSRSKNIDKDEIISILKQSFNSQNKAYERHTHQINNILKKFNISNYAI